MKRAFAGIFLLFIVGSQCMKYINEKFGDCTSGETII